MKSVFMCSFLFLFSLIVTVTTAWAGRDISSDVNLQYGRSFDLLLKNISPADGARGSVVAAPSHDNPNYYFHWIRDSALTMESLVQIYANGGAKLSLSRADIKQIIKDYVTFSRGNQLTPNRSGGLGEPKFNMDGSAFNGDWGRPQNDGPALRAITLIHFANALLDEGGEEAYVRSVLYDGRIPAQSVIKSDLEYSAYHWQDPCFDLWEETYGHHFYTTLVNHRAMVEGAQLADRLGDDGAASYYRMQAQNIETVLPQFWDASMNTFIATRDVIIGPRVHKVGIDVAIVLGALHGATDDGFMNITDERLMSSANVIMKSFTNIYDINHNTDLAPAIGRYPEDVYSGTDFNEGNPWFLATLAYSEYCSRLRVAFERTGHIAVTALNQNFLNYVLQGQINVHAGDSIDRGSYAFTQVLASLTQTSDQFLRTVLAHKADDGSMSEQFSRHNGYMLSAPNLSWSHAAFLTSKYWRDQK